MRRVSVPTAADAGVEQGAAGGLVEAGAHGEHDGAPVGRDGDGRSPVVEVDCADGGVATGGGRADGAPAVAADIGPSVPTVRVSAWCNHVAIRCRVRSSVTHGTSCALREPTRSRSGVAERGGRRHHRPGGHGATVERVQHGTRLGGDEAAGGEVPPCESPLEVGVEAPAGDEHRSTAAAPSRRMSRTCGSSPASTSRLGAPPLGAVGEPGADQRRGRGRSRSEHAIGAPLHRSHRRRGWRCRARRARRRRPRRPPRPRRPRPRSTRPSRGGRRGSWWCRRAGRSPSGPRSCPAASPPSSPTMPSSGRAAEQARRR